MILNSQDLCHKVLLKTWIHKFWEINKTKNKMKITIFGKLKNQYKVNFRFSCWMIEHEDFNKQDVCLWTSVLYGTELQKLQSSKRSMTKQVTCGALVYSSTNSSNTSFTTLTMKTLMANNSHSKVTPVFL